MALIDAYNPEGHTALHSAVITQNVECARILLESGASIEDIARNGRTPLTLAIIHNSHAIQKLFVDRRFKGPQVLAVIAEHTDTETMSIIGLSLPLKLSLNPAADGFAAGREILRQRTDYNERLGHAFEEMLSSISTAKEDAAASNVRSGLLGHLSTEPSFCEELAGQSWY
ncbi:uncharacterized protein B0T15DRAFT_508259 [Chaetomium strumarium]|uniref:Uncharacterized protein n=1 Tax=Chaetomium strumarium TaxID=1170767 RepID=A0AAJ0M7I3_9PEZI|nr:hypothetical protein B0T15DRAFT_508259 [Chaetomium strumarium]